MTRRIGPLLNNLVVHRIRYFGDTEYRALKWIDSVMAAMREASLPNPWIMVDEESLAAEILRGLKAKTKKQLSASRR